jgi:hypothetical protein
VVNGTEAKRRKSEKRTVFYANAFAFARLHNLK